MSRTYLLVAVFFGLASSALPQGRTSSQDPRLEKKVTSNVEGNLASVLKWLSGQGVSFIVRDAVPGSGNTIRINVVNQPLRDVMDAIAYCMNGHWDRVSNIYVLRSGKAEDGTVYEAIAVPERSDSSERVTTSHKTETKAEVISATAPKIVDEAKLRKSMDKEQWGVLVKKNPLPVALLARWQQKYLQNVPTNYMLRLKWDGTLYLAEK